jgi:hypothetical protein
MTVRTHHEDGTVTGGLVSERRVGSVGETSTSVSRDNGRNGSVRYSHVGFSKHKHWLSAKVVDEENGGDGHDKVDDSNDTGGCLLAKSWAN